jgi:NAD(P)-dependent dehydrogenase (short-subunit alcohol dehydrogenase family)
MGDKGRSRIELRAARVLVTGAGSGIGRATALAFAAEGAHVLAVDIDADAAELAAKECSALGPEASAHRLDVADRDAVLALARDVHADGGALDVLVNNAGVGVSGGFAETSLEDWDWILGINLMGVIFGCHAFGPAMVERGRGHIVNIASALGYTPRATEPAYCTTKAGVLALSRCLRAEWGPAGVGVSAICPGVINTAIVRQTRFLGERAASHEGAVQLFAKRGHAPSKVASAILDSVRRDRPVVPVGPEAWVGWFAHRLLPSRATDVVARASIGGV